MQYSHKVTEIFCIVDEFYKEFEPMLQKRSIGKRPTRLPSMSPSEIMTILILFHLSGFRTLKQFYLFYVKKHMSSEFPHTLSYNRFIELVPRVLLPLTVFLKLFRSGDCTGISFVDSTPIRVCKKKRIPRNKVFQHVAKIGKSTVGWFYGFKLHIIINDKGEIIDFTITPANTDDREPLKKKTFLKKIYGKLFGDKGYISQDLFKLLWVDGIHLVTGIKNNMKNSLMSMQDKVLLRKRSVIETVNDELKNICQIEHSRHRSVGNFVVNLIAGMVAYSFLPKKPSIKFNREYTQEVALF